MSAIVATNVTYDTVFSWSPPPSGYYVMLTAVYTGWLVQRVTAEASVTLYDLRPLFSNPLFGYDGSWSLTAIGPASTMDDVLVADHSYWTNGGDAVYLLGTETRTFKEAPFEPDEP